MAIDEAISRAVAAGLAPPTLRLYAWAPPCLSLGRAQPFADVDLEALHTAGFDLVRRPTGGKAILHADELTYSVIAPESEPRVTGGVTASYRRLSQGLLCALKELGIPNVEISQRVERRSSNSPVCFEAPSDYEITAGGRKLVGSAQMRAHGTVLQHGAIPLDGDIARLCLVLADHPGPAYVHSRATTVAGELGRPVTWDEAADALALGFARALNLHLEAGSLTDEERAWVEELRTQKYTTDAWTRRV